jgi:enoyl-CoA hydratase/carnithine racemase
MTDHISTRIDDGILSVQFNRPEKKNALTGAMYLSIAEGISRAERDQEVRVITVTGTGDSFTSGNDIADFLQQGTPADEPPVSIFLRAIANAKKPLIAGVNGMAVGIGVTMLLHFDLVYAAESSTFQMPFTNLGLAPEAGSSLFLPRLVGHQRAAELMLLGERFDAERAREIGIVTAIFSADELASVVRERAVALTRKSSASIQTTKALLKRDGENVLGRMALERAEFSRLLHSTEAQQIMRRFMERRPKTDKLPPP